MCQCVATQIIIEYFNVNNARIRLIRYCEYCSAFLITVDLIKHSLNTSEYCSAFLNTFDIIKHSLKTSELVIQCSSEHQSIALSKTIKTKTPVSVIVMSNPFESAAGYPHTLAFQNIAKTPAEPNNPRHFGSHCIMGTNAELRSEHRLVPITKPPSLSNHC